MHQRLTKSIKNGNLTEDLLKEMVCLFGTKNSKADDGVEGGKALSPDKNSSINYHSGSDQKD